ncbi:MAG: glycosyltransferase family 4 protein [Chloroflexi bacterium]|nr:glycosyltransferase family 4 protein [Chloroflexota bacterium]
MKIAMLSPYDFAIRGGVQTHVVELSNALIEAGHDVRVMAPCTGNEPVYDMRAAPLETFGRTVPFVTAGSVARISLSVWYQRKLMSILENQNFDVVHIHEPLMPMFGLMASYYSPSPTIGTFHAYNEGPGRGYLFWKRVLNKGAVRLNGRIAVSEPARQFASKYFRGEYTVIPNGVHYPHFSTPAPRPTVYKKDAFNLFFVGRMSEKRKGLKYLLGAYSRLKWQYPKLRLVVGGAGVPDRDSYRMMGERGIDDVIFVGPVSDEDLPGYYQHADVFCAPNTGKESFGMIIVEAMAAGTPVVASDIPGFRAVMQHGRQGLFVEPKSEQAIAEAIDCMIRNPGETALMGINGAATSHQYNWTEIAERVLGYYESVLCRHPVPPSLYRG